MWLFLAAGAAAGVAPAAGAEQGPAVRQFRDPADRAGRGAVRSDRVHRRADAAGAHVVFIAGFGVAALIEKADIMITAVLIACWQLRHRCPPSRCAGGPDRRRCGGVPQRHGPGGARDIVRAEGPHRPAEARALSRHRGRFPERRSRSGARGQDVSPRLGADAPASATSRCASRRPRPGRYALLFTHDRDGKNKFNFWRDGAGFPSNAKLGRSRPKVSAATDRRSAAASPT